MTRDELIERLKQLAAQEYDYRRPRLSKPKVIGATIYNGANESVGKIDDIIVAQDGKAPFAVISVGGFLGLGDRLVILPYEQFRTDGERLVLPGATKDALKNLPEFKYASK